MNIIFILLAGLVLRVISLNQSLWLDEATTALAAKMSLNDLFIKFLPGDFHPPLYYLVVKYWILIFGSSEVSLRVPSVVFGLGTVYLTYLIARKVYNTKVAVVSALLLATSGLSVYYSQEARMYSLAAFLVAGAIYFFLKEKWLYFSVFLVLTGMTDYVALLILPVFWIFAARKQKFIISNIPLVLVFLSWLPVFYKQLLAGLSVRESVSEWWKILGTVSLKNIALFPVKFILGRISFDNNLIYGLVFIPVFALFVYVLSKTLKSSKIVWYWLMLPVVVGILIAFKIPTLSYFRFIFCLPPLYILTAYGLSRFGNSKFWIMLSFILLVNLSSTSYYLFNHKFQREDWRGLVGFVESKRTPNSVTVFVADSNMEAYRYYAPDAKITGPEGVKPGYDQIWLMTYLGDIFDKRGLVKKKVEDSGYKFINEYDYDGVGVLEYIYENSN